MPTYEYRCEHCGTFEASHSIKDPALTACPTCGQPVVRLISAGAGFIFKGSGFYITDYRKPGYAEKAKADKPAEAAKPGEAAKSPEGAKAAETSKPAETKPAAEAPKAAPPPAAPPASGGTP